MNVRMTAAALAAGIGIFSVSLAEAGRYNGGGCGGWGARSPYDQLFDSSSVVEVVGKVEQVEQFAPHQGMVTGIRFDLLTDEGRFPVHLGPEWFLRREGFRVQDGDRIELRASMVTIDDRLTLMAIEVVASDELLRLRGENGYPAWIPDGEI